MLVPVENSSVHGRPHKLMPLTDARPPLKTHLFTKSVLLSSSSAHSASASIAASALCSPKSFTDDCRRPNVLSLFNLCQQLFL